LNPAKYEFDVTIASGSLTQHGVSAGLGSPLTRTCTGKPQETSLMFPSTPVSPIRTGPAVVKVVLDDPTTGGNVVASTSGSVTVTGAVSQRLPNPPNVVPGTYTEQFSSFGVLTDGNLVGVVNTWVECRKGIRDSVDAVMSQGSTVEGTVMAPITGPFNDFLACTGAQQRL
jgi:hypothetical protein